MLGATKGTRGSVGVTLLLAAACAVPRPPVAAPGAASSGTASSGAASSGAALSQPPLAGTGWRLVRFEGGDDAVRTPRAGHRFTIAFADSGVVVARLDCNRGRGSWTSPEPGQLRLGPMRTTLALCPDSAMEAHLVAHWDAVRSYVVRDGHLFVSLLADGGIYEWAPDAEARAELRAEGRAEGRVGP